MSSLLAAAEAGYQDLDAASNSRAFMETAAGERPHVALDRARRRRRPTG